MSNVGKVISVNISEEKGTVKHPVDQCVVDIDGVRGDAHAGVGHRQVSLLGQKSIDRFAGEIGRTIQPGEFAENITVGDLDLGGAAVFDRFSIGKAELEVTQIGKPCHGEGCAIFREVGKCVMPKEGIFCRVLEPGRIRPGDAIDYERKTLRVSLITLSDRAKQGAYEDRSGARARELLGQFLADTRWQSEIKSLILADEAEQLSRELGAAGDSGVDVVFTIGGTGVGPRDITPQTVAEFCDRLIPGVMEAIRLKFGAQNPRALLSRSVAGVAGQMLVYALPGSVRAVEEYLGEIFHTLEHLLQMVRGLDVH